MQAAFLDSAGAHTACRHGVRFGSCLPPFLMSYERSLSRQQIEFSWTGRRRRKPLPLESAALLRTTSNRIGAARNTIKESAAAAMSAAHEIITPV